jgi:hypothetical protein
MRMPVIISRMPYVKNLKYERKLTCSSSQTINGHTIESKLNQFCFSLLIQDCEME